MCSRKRSTDPVIELLGGAKNPVAVSIKLVFGLIKVIALLRHLEVAVQFLAIHRDRAGNPGEFRWRIRRAHRSPMGTDWKSR